MTLKRLVWYWKRLHRMSLQEVSHRLTTSLYSRAQSVFRTAQQPPTADLSQASTFSWPPGDTELPTVDYCRAADKILEGKLTIFALRDTPIGHPPQWNRDPLSGKEAPLIFGKTLNYRNTELVGDIKYLWEPNRHMQWVTLAQAYRQSGETRYLQGLAVQLTSWLDQCPYLLGPNWVSSLELGLRLVNWSFVWGIIGGANSPLFSGVDGKQLQDRWLDSIYQHISFIQGYPSLFSSANNHLIGELAGLFVGTVTWPCWPETDHWRQKAQEALIREALCQNWEDGVNKEQATDYQQFVTDFLLVAGLVGRGHGVEFPQEFWERIERTMEYLASVMDVSGEVPMIGDSDDGLVTGLSQNKDFSPYPYRSLLATGAVVFGRGDFKVKAGKFDDKSLWLLGEQGEKQFADISSQNVVLPIRRAFPQGGYYILGKDFETDQEVRLVVDAGPLGYLSLAAHGHADALAFTLSVYGNNFLIDPGTFAYHTQETWRNYFRGTSAHNTVRVDGEDQSVIEGNFMWAHHADAICEDWESSPDIDRFVGSHNGYLRLEDPVVHRRNLCLFKKENRLVVTDILECKGKHRIEHFWHFSDTCLVTVSGLEVTAKQKGVQMNIRALDQVDSNAPPLSFASFRARKLLLQVGSPDSSMKKCRPPPSFVNGKSMEPQFLRQRLLGITKDFLSIQKSKFRIYGICWTPKMRQLVKLQSPPLNQIEEDRHEHTKAAKSQR